MAKWLKDYLSFGSRRSPPQPPKPDYTESDILKAYRAQKSLDFEDPYEEGDSGKLDEVPREEVTPSVGLEGKYGSPKHRLIKVEASDLNRSKALLTADEGSTQPDQNESQQAFDPQRILQLPSCSKDPPIETPGESEYSDPFDAHRELKEDLEEDAGSEDNGYMEPYDAQKVVVDFQSKTNWDDQGAKKSRIDLQLYDTPYEEKEMEADAEGPSAETPRESRLPQNDERPADEYDQPWEWKKNHISRAFAVDIKESKVLPWPPPVGELTGSEEGLDPEVQFDNPDWERTSSASSAHKEHWRQHLTTPPSKFGRPQSPEHSLLVAEHVDPSVPLENQAWFHGTISRADAESLLTLCKEGSYLVRNSETSRNDYSLSLRSSQGFMHMKFTQTKESKYILGQNSAPFDSIPEVIHHYATQELPIKGAENLSLLYPVAVQTL